MPGMGEDGLVKVEEWWAAGVVGGDAAFFEVGAGKREPGSGRIGTRGTDFGEAVGCFLGEAEDFGHFSEGGAGAVGDDVGGHGGSARGVFLEDVLNDCFAAVTGREVDIDVGPGFAVFGEEALEEEPAADGIDGGDAQAVAHGGVGGGAPALAEDALGLGEADDFPDDEKVASESELLDESEFMIKVVADFLT